MADNVDMTEVNDAVAVVAEMLQQANAQRFSEAVASAERVMRLAREVENPTIRGILGATATSTWLTSKAVLNPEDPSLIGRCEGVFELLGGSGLDQGATTAIVALGVKIQLLLQARKPTEAERVSEQLASFYVERPAGAKLAEQSAEVIRIASNMVAMQAPAPAASLARRVVDRFATAESSEERVVAATAQAWIVIATMARDDKSILGFPAPPGSTDDLRSILDADDPPGLEQAGTETNELIAMGDSALQAIEAVLPRLKQHGPQWDNPRLLLSAVQIATLGELGRHEERQAAELKMVNEFGNSEDWRVDEFVGWIQRNLEKPH